MTVWHCLIIIKEIAENYKIKELVLEYIAKATPVKRRSHGGSVVSNYTYSC